MKKVVVTLFALSSILVYAQTQQNKPTLTSVPLGNYIDCYAAIEHSGDISWLTRSFVGVTKVLDVKGTKINALVLPEVGARESLIMTYKEAITPDEFKNAAKTPEKIAAKLDKYLVIPAQADYTDKSSTSAFYVFTPFGAYTYTFDNTKLLSAGSKLEYVYYADFRIFPGEGDPSAKYQMVVMYQRAFAPDGIYHNDTNFCSYPEKTDVVTKLTGVKNETNSLYWTDLLKRMQVYLDSLDKTDAGLTQDGINVINKLCKPIAAVSPDIQSGLNDLHTSAWWQEYYAKTTKTTR